MKSRFALVVFIPRFLSKWSNILQVLILPLVFDLCQWLAYNYRCRTMANLYRGTGDISALGSMTNVAACGIVVPNLSKTKEVFP
jgi:hypothetical protein